MLTKPYETYEKPGIVVSYPLTEQLADRAAIFKGGLVGWSNTKQTVLPLPSSADDTVFIGVANETVRAQDAKDSKRITVTKSGTFVYKFNGDKPNIASVVYATNDDTVISGQSHTSQMAVGTVVGYEMTSDSQSGVRVRIDNFVN